MIHELKILPVFFEAVVDGRKTFEVRVNDRDYHEGDILALNEWISETGTYTGRSCVVYVDYMLVASEIDLDFGYVYMAIKPCRIDKGRFDTMKDPLSGKMDYRVPVLVDTVER